MAMDNTFGAALVERARSITATEVSKVAVAIAALRFLSSARRRKPQKCLQGIAAFNICAMMDAKVLGHYGGKSPLSH